MKSTDSIGVTFVNLVLGRGILNGIVNVQLGTWLFGAKENGDGVDPEPAVSCRLRMDVACAKSLRDNLDELLKQIEGPAPVAGIAQESTEPAAANGAAKH